MGRRFTGLNRIAVVSAALGASFAWTMASAAQQQQSGPTVSDPAGIPAPASFTDNPRVIVHYAARTAVFSDYPALDGGVAFVGDSLTEQGDWAGLFPGVPILNFGISGDRAEGVAARYAQVTRVRPGRILLMIGTNNLSRGVSAAAVNAEVDRVLGLWRETLPETDLVVQSVLPRQPEFAPSIAELNRLLRDTAGRNGAAFIDLHAAFAVEDGRLDPTVTNDGLHLNTVGYDRWAAAVEECVRTGDCA